MKPCSWFSGILADFHRKKHAPHGWLFARNFKQKNSHIIQNAIKQAKLENDAVISTTAYKDNGKPLPEKIALYLKDQATTSLFFQFYATIKSKTKQKE